MRTYKQHNHTYPIWRNLAFGKLFLVNPIGDTFGQQKFQWNLDPIKIFDLEFTFEFGLPIVK